MALHPIMTERLLLVPSSLAVEEAILANRELIPLITGYEMASDWPGKDWLEVLPAFIDDYRCNPEWCGWNWHIVSREHHMLIGAIGCTVPPDVLDTVSIGYYLATKFRRQGYMREAAHAFVAWLQQHRNVRCITAQCGVENVASQRILISVGMRAEGRFTDEEGEKIHWRMPIDPANE